MADKSYLFSFVVTVKCATREEAETVMAERLGHDEDYGFEYTVDWEDHNDYRYSA